MAANSGPWPTRLTGLSLGRTALISVGLGAMIGSGLAPLSLLWIAIPALLLAVYLAISAVGPRGTGWLGFWVGFGYAATSLSWIVEPFLVDVARHGWMAPFALMFMAAGFGAFWGLGFWLAGRTTPAHGAARALALAACWTGAELLRSYLFGGFPWGLLSYIWIDTPIYQLAAVVGPHGLTLLTVGLATLLALGISRRNLPIMLVTVAVIGLATAAGMALLGPGAPPPQTQPLVRLIQPNADQHEKWDPEMMPVFFDRQIALTREFVDPPPDLVIWPEVAVPFLLNDEIQPFADIAAAAGSATVILGAQRLEGRRAYNSMAVLGGNGDIIDIYDKHHLVPFGEYLPGGALLNKIGLSAMAAQFGYGYSAGQGPKTLDLGKFGKVLPLICYEGIFPHELRDTVTRPDWMLMITNDAWFGNYLGPAQHLAQAQARTIELGLPMVRVANTGISAVIDANGRIVDALPQGVAGRLDVRLPVARKATLYARAGDAPVVALLMILASLCLYFRRVNPIDHDAADV